MSHKVLITRKLPGQHVEWLKERCEVSVYQGEGTIPRDVLLDQVQDVDGLLCTLTELIDRELLDCAPKLKVVSNYAVGYNNIDVVACSNRGIVVTNTPGVLTETTADFAFALLLAVARRVVEADRCVRKGRFKGWSPTMLLGTDVHGKTLGIVGMGRIGRALARRAKGFNMHIIYHDSQRVEMVEKELQAEFVSLSELLRRADFVSLHVPYFPPDHPYSTHHLLDREAFAVMKSSAFLINTARGAVVDEEALVEALRSGQIAGAGLDVYENEPLLSAGLTALPNVVLAPHIGSASYETRTKMAEVAVKNLWNVLQGQNPLHAVNPEVLNQ